MVPGLNADILHRQRQARLVAKNGLMLRAVILKHPVNVLLLGAEHEVQQENANFQQTFQHVPPPQGKAREIVQQCAGKQRRQHQKQKYRHSDAHQHRKGHKGLFQLFAAEVLFHPLLKFGGLRGLLVRVEICGIHQGLHAADHRRQKIHGAPHQRQT